MPVTATAQATDTTYASTDAAAQNSGVINPYALAELIIGRRLDWKQLSHRPQLLEDILQTPYDELFDPKFGGPLYTGLRLNEQLELERVHSPLLDIELTVQASDLERDLTDLSTIRVLGDLGKVFQVPDVARLEVRRAELIGHRNLAVTVRLPDREYYQRISAILTKDIVKAIAFDPSHAIFVDGWTPPGGTWSDQGQFFNEAAEFFDPVQGAVPNCYFIAALAAVAWAMPYRVRHMTRATGLPNQSFTNQITFYKPDSGGQIDKEIEVTDTIPVMGGGAMYARSSEAGEIWPGVYEKAFAKLKTGVANDMPDITATGWGDCVEATAQLTGGRRSYYGTPNFTGDQLWDIVRGNSRSYRTFNPMTAWTYSTGDGKAKKVVYSDGNIAASHCYTVLGWAYRDGVKYLLLRNPWGHTEASVGTLGGSVALYDISWWRPINLTTVDGTFALEVNTFKHFFAGLGVAK